MKKRILAMLLAGAMAVTAFTGCTIGERETTDSASTETEGEEGATDIDWPTKTITFVCTHSAGGDTDYNARLLARLLEEKLGVSVVVNNVTGSNGAIAMTQYKDENPDGYTFVLTNTAALTGNQATGLADYGYDAFEVVSVYGKQSGENIVVPADSPYNTVEDLINASKENPGEIKFGISTGGGVYIASVIMEKTYGAQFNIIDAGDAAERTTSLLGGHVDATIVPYSSAKEYIENGDMKSLCTLLGERADLIPDIETASEQGCDELVLNTMYACLAPKGTDTAVVQALNDAIVDISNNSEEFKTEVNSYNFQEPSAMTIDESLTELKDQTDLFMKYSDYLK